MPPFRLTTPFGSEEGASRERIEEALEAADRAVDPECFAVVSRDDGVFVQLSAGGPLEVGGTGDLPDRLDHAALAREIVGRLSRGQEPWGDLPHWDMATVRERQRRVSRRPSLYVAVAILAMGLTIAAVIWFASR